MKLRVVLFIIAMLVFAFFVSNLNKNQLDYTLDFFSYKNVRNAAWSFVEQQCWTQYDSKEEWDQASVKKITANGNYTALDGTYKGQEILVVTLNDAIAAPSIFVDPKSYAVIGCMPGE